MTLTARRTGNLRGCLAVADWRFTLTQLLPLPSSGLRSFQVILETAKSNGNEIKH
jgi:hypothetical protein